VDAYNMISKNISLYKEKLINSKNHLFTKFHSLSTAEKVYIIGAAFLGVYIVSGIPIIALGKKEWLDYSAKYLMYLVAASFTIATTIECLSSIKILLKKHWFKWFIGILAVPVYLYSDLHGQQFINNFTLNEPSYFPTASIALRAFFLPYTWLLLVYVILFGILILSIFIAPLKTRLETAAGGWSYLGRTIGFIVLISLLHKTTTFFEDESQLSFQIAKGIVLSSEYFKKTHCSNVKDGEYSAYLDRGYISIFTPFNESFRTEKCNVDIMEPLNK
jgi:hypothetical protein